MKRFFLLLSITAFFAVGCSKDEVEPRKDLADQIVGIYEGDLMVTGQSTDKTSVRVTKLSKDKVHIQSFVDGKSSSFTANLDQEEEFIIINIPEQLMSGGGTIRGNPYVSEGYPDDHGVYETHTKAFGYGLKISANGIEIDERFIGLKK